MRNNSASIRNNSLVKGLIELGHTVDVLTVSYPDSETSETLKEGNIICTDLINWGGRAKINKLAKHSTVLSFLRRMYLAWVRVSQFPDRFYKWPERVDYSSLGIYDLMISSSDAKVSHFVGRKYKRTYPSVPWIQIWGDPWMSDVNANWTDKIRIPFYEKKLINEADAVVYISEPTANEIKQKYPKYKQKIHFIPRSYYSLCEYDVSKTGDMHIVYTGAIRGIYGRKIDSFVKVLDGYNNLHDRKIILDIYGHVDDAIKETCFSENVHYYNGVDVSELPSVYKKANALLYLSNKQESTQIPGKLFDYLGTSSIILCLVNQGGDPTTDFLQSIGPKCFLISNDFKSLNNTIDSVVEKMQSSYPPVCDYAPRVIAEKITSIL